MIVRVLGGLVALAFAELLVLTAIETFSPPTMVVPTNGVIAGPADDIPADQAALDALAARTSLQDYRGDTGPSPDAGTGVLAEGTPLSPGTTGESGAALVNSWLANENADAGILREAQHLEGHASLPAAQYGVLEQPEGRDFRRTHNGLIKDGGGWLIFGAGFLLAAFLLLRGRVPIGRSSEGTTIERFDGIERTNHWMTAVSFLALALTGLVLLYNKNLLVSWLGAEAASSLTSACLFIHLAFIAPFLIGVGLMAVLWLGQNLPDRYDWPWLKRFGGMLGDGEHPPAARFNAGQKIIFWGVMLGALVEAASGFTLIYPFFWTDVNILQWVLIGHAGVGLLFIAMIMGHIYIGTVGMVGAIHAMWSGRVDTAWAKAHHSVWYARATSPEAAGEHPGSGHRPDPAPAE